MVAVCLGLWAAAPATAEVRHNPGYDRPGLGFTPAALQAGDVTIEQGAPDWSRVHGASGFTADTLLRAGVGHALEVQLGSGWNWSDTGDAMVRGRSDSVLGLKIAPPAQGRFSWGLLGSIEFTDGARAFRSDRRQYLLGASFNWQHGDNRSTGLYAEAQSGDIDSQLLAINEGWSTTSTLGVFVEAAAQHTQASGYGGVAGAGLSWQVTPRVQLDLGARHRVAGHADTWQGGMGVSVYFGD
jgi:hypothetical protein